MLNRPRQTVLCTLRGTRLKPHAHHSAAPPAPTPSASSPSTAPATPTRHPRRSTPTRHPLRQRRPDTRSGNADPTPAPATPTRHPLPKPSRSRRRYQPTTAQPDPDRTEAHTRPLPRRRSRGHHDQFMLSAAARVTLRCQGLTTGHRRGHPLRAHRARPPCTIATSAREAADQRPRRCKQARLSRQRRRTPTALWNLSARRDARRRTRRGRHLPRAPATESQNARATSPGESPPLHQLPKGQHAPINDRQDSGTNKHLLHHLYTEASEGNGQPLLDSLAEDIEWTIIGSTPLSGAYTGKHEVLDGLLSALCTRLDGRVLFAFDRFIEQGEYVVMQARGRATAVGGAPYNNTYCIVARIVDGKIREMTATSTQNWSTLPCSPTDARNA